MADEAGGAPPDNTLIRTQGTMFTDRPLDKGEEIHIQVLDMAGVVVANGYGKVVSVTFKDWLDKDGELTATDRVAGVKVS